MASVVPTVNAASPAEYAEMMKRAAALSNRVHVDASDGKFTDSSTINVAQITVPEGVELDVHLMVEQPHEVIETALSLKPRLIIFHVESEGDLTELIKRTRKMGVKAGIALLQRSQPQQYRSLIEMVDHALIFTGTLGHNGGQLDIDQLVKVAEVRKVKPEIEVSVDGGVNAHNASLIVMQDVNILYSGGAIQNAADPRQAYADLQQQAGASV